MSIKFNGKLIAGTPDVSNKQDTLVSGENIKTLNNQSILGSGNLELDSLPSQEGNEGKFLTTDGATTSWSDLPVGEGLFLKNNTIYTTPLYQISKSTTNTIILDKTKNIYTIDVSDNTEFTFDTSGLTNISSDTTITFELKLKLSSVSTLTFPSSVIWLNDEAPDLSVVGTYYLVFRTDNYGATWIGNLQGLWGV